MDLTLSLELNWASKGTWCYGKGITWREWIIDAGFHFDKELRVGGVHIRILGLTVSLAFDLR